MENKEFYQNDFDTQDSVYATVYFRLDKKYDIQFREVYSISGLLGDIGGLGGALLTGSSFVVYVLLHKYLYTSIATKIYRTEKDGKAVPKFHESDMSDDEE